MSLARAKSGAPEPSSNQHQHACTRPDTNGIPTPQPCTGSHSYLGNRSSVRLFRQFQTVQTVSDCSDNIAPRAMRTACRLTPHNKRQPRDGVHITSRPKSGAASTYHFFQTRNQYLPFLSCTKTVPTIPSRHDTSTYQSFKT